MLDITLSDCQFQRKVSVARRRGPAGPLPQVCQRCAPRRAPDGAGVGAEVELDLHARARRRQRAPDRQLARA